MSEYTPEDFANARFAVNVDGRRAIRMAGGHWRTSNAGLYPHVALIEDPGWRPVVEAGDPEAIAAVIGGQATRVRELDAERDTLEDLREENDRLERILQAPLSLKDLEAAWENAEVPTRDNPIREGDELIVKHWEEGWEWVALCPGSDSGNWISDARVLHRAPQPDPWQDLADVLGGWLESPTELAKYLHERGVRVVGGDDA